MQRNKTIRIIIFLIFLIMSTIIFGCDNKSQNLENVDQNKANKNKINNEATNTPDRKIGITLKVDAPCSINNYHFDISQSTLKLVFIGPAFDKKHIGHIQKDGISIQIIDTSSTINYSKLNNSSLNNSIIGEWQWLGSNELSFTPDKNWISNSQYKIIIDNKVIPSEFKLINNDITFSPRGNCYSDADLGYKISAPSIVKLIPAPLNITFYHANAPIDKIDKSLSNLNITISPKINGEWKWSTSKDLTFLPTDQWMPGINYKVTVPKEIFAEDALIPTFNYQFAIPGIKATLSQSEFYSDPEKPIKKNIVATISLNNLIDKSDFEKHIHIFHKKNKSTTEVSNINDLSEVKELGFKVNYSEDNLKAFISSEDIHVLDSDSTATIKIDDGFSSFYYPQIKGVGAITSITIPGIDNYFKIESVNTSTVENNKYGIDQVFVVNTTASTKAQEMDKSISLYLLPEYYQENNSSKNDDPTSFYEWNSISEITPEIIKKSEKLNLSIQSINGESSKLLSWKFIAPPKRYVYALINEGIVSADGYKMPKKFEQILFIGDLPKTVKILSKGALLNITGEKKLSILTRDVNTLEITTHRILPLTINHLVSQTSGDFQKPSFNYNFSADDIGERMEDSRNFSNLKPGQNNYTSIDFGALLRSKSNNPNGLFYISLTGKNKNKESKREKKPEKDIQETNNFDSEDISEEPNDESFIDKRLILVTDLGILVKENQNNSRDIFIQSISKGEPVTGVKVEVIGRNGLSLISSVTDKMGHVAFTSLDDFGNEKKASSNYCRN